MAYLYVLWSPQDEFVKIGISRNRQKRQNAHCGNSSNPLEFVRWKLYQIDRRDDAAKLERYALQELARRGFQFRGKRELFRCGPVVVTETIEKVALREGIPFLKNYPQDTEHLLSMGLDFVDFPYQLRDALSPLELEIYLQGAFNALSVLRYLGGTNFSGEELACMASSVLQSRRDGIELWRRMLETLAIVVRDDEERLSVVRDAEGRIEKDQIEAFDAWQDIEVDDREAA